MISSRERVLKSFFLFEISYFLKDISRLYENSFNKTKDSRNSVV